MTNGETMEGEGEEEEAIGERRRLPSSLKKAISDDKLEESEKGDK